MKKSLLALAVLGAFATAASAQSSVTMFGTMDIAGRYVKADGQARQLSEVTNGINSSQLGFKGTEDLGGGLKAGFELLADLAGVDSGNVGSKFFGRRSVVKLIGNFGEVRLGRDYTPTFWNQTIFDAFGTNGLGSSLNPRQQYGSTRADNSIGYFLPSNLGGFYGQAMVAASERGTELDKGGRFVGGRVGFAAGPFDVAFAASEWRIDAAAGAPQFKEYNIGGSYDLGVAKLMGYFDRTTFVNSRENFGSISAVIPFGQSEVHVGYDRSKLTNSGASTSVDQIKATYQYNLSKRTALYTTASRLSNKDATTKSLGLPTTLNGKSSGIEFGLRHFF